MRRNEIKLFEKAMSQRWGIRQEYRDLMIRRLTNIIANPSSSNREVTAASRALIAAESQNQQDEHETERIDSLDESRNRFLAIAAKLGIGSTIETTVVDRSEASSELDFASRQETDQA